VGGKHMIGDVTGLTRTIAARDRKIAKMRDEIEFLRAAIAEAQAMHDERANEARDAVLELARNKRAAELVKLMPMGGCVK